jgi:transposase
MKGQTFDMEFRINALKLVEELGQSISQVSTHLGVSKTTLYEWQKMKRQGKLSATHFPGKGQMKPEDEAMKRLRRENEVLKRERDILKKALAIFSSPSHKDMPL